MIIAILDDYHGLVPALDCFTTLSVHEVRVFRDAAPAFDTLIANLRDAEVIVPIRERTRFTRAVIEKLPQLRHISQTGRSVRHIDIAACTERGIAVTAGSHASPYTVAEHTWTLILAALRRIPEEIALMKRGEWRGSFSLGLRGRTLGIFGLGQIGSLVAATGASFGMRILVWGREASLAAARKAGYGIASGQAELFEQADVLSLCVRLSKETRGIVTVQDLARMKPTALIVNTARAELIASNALCTPHSAWIEQDTYELYFGEAFAQVIAFAAGEPVNVVNPEALEGR